MNLTLNASSWIRSDQPYGWWFQIVVQTASTNSGDATYYVDVIWPGACLIVRTNTRDATDDVDIDDDLDNDAAAAAAALDPGVLLLPVVYLGSSHPGSMKVNGI